MSKALLISFAAVLLGGCAVGPNYHRSSAAGTNAIPANFSSGTDSNGVAWNTAHPSADRPRGDWWALFDDRTLAELESLSAGNSQQLAAAVARYQEAIALVKISRADFFPQVDLTPSYSRQRTSFNEPQNGVSAQGAHTFSTFSLSLQAGWEPDLWGRVRRQVESSRARLVASRDDAEAVKLGIQAEVASDYFTLRSIDVELALLARTVDAYQRSLELTRNRRKGGASSDLDVSQAETQLKTAEAQIPALRLQRERLLHALAVLCGKPATGFNLNQAERPLKGTPEIPVSQPSELLERRPDVAAAEQRMASANAQIGVAETAFFPRLRINGLAGLQSVSASTFFDWPSRLWAVGPSLDLPLFTGGRNRAQLELARATYNETVANYRQTTLAAFQEVEDQLVAQQLLATQIEAEAAALAAANHTLEIANNRYKAGLITFLEVAIAQSSALNLERTVVQLQGQKLVASVTLVKALGGGWER